MVQTRRGRLRRAAVNHAENGNSEMQDNRDNDLPTQNPQENENAGESTTNNQANVPVSGNEEQASLLEELRNLPQRQQNLNPDEIVQNSSIDGPSGSSGQGSVQSYLPWLPPGNGFNMTSATPPYPWPINPFWPQVGQISFHQQQQNPPGPFVNFPQSSQARSQAPHTAANISDVASVSLGRNIDGPETFTENCKSLKLATQLLQNFDGSNMTVKEFIDDCRHIYNQLKPSDRDTYVRFMKNKITGEARSHLKITPGELSFEKIVECLERAYKSKATLDGLMSELDTLRQIKGESVLAYYNRVKDLLNQTTDAADNECERNEAECMKERAKRRAAHCYIRGLHRYIGDSVVSSVPSTLEEALKRAQDREQYLAEQERLNPPRTQFKKQGPNIETNTLNLPFKNQRINTEALEPRTTACVYATGISGQKRKLCFTCESTDHLRPNCPYLPAKRYCTYCKTSNHCASRCFKLHSKEKVMALIDQDKRARLERDSNERMEDQTINRPSENQNHAGKKDDLNNKGTPQSGGSRSAAIIIPPLQPFAASTITLN